MPLCVRRYKIAIPSYTRCYETAGLKSLFKRIHILANKNLRAFSLCSALSVVMIASGAQAQIAFEGAESPQGTVSGNVDLDEDGVFTEGTWSLVSLPSNSILQTNYPPSGGVSMRYRRNGVYDINAVFEVDFTDPEVTYQTTIYGNEDLNQAYESRAFDFTVTWVGGVGAAQVFDPSIYDQIDDTATVTGPNSITIFQNSVPAAAANTCAWNGNAGGHWRNRCLEWYVVLPNGATSVEVDVDGGTAAEGFRLAVVSYADLIVEKTVSDTELNVGDSGSFTIEVTNNNIPGNSVSLGTALTDVLPAGLTFDGATISTDGANAGGTYDPVSGEWNLGRLSLGETATLQIDFTVDDGTVLTTITNSIDPVTIVSNQVDLTDNHISLSASVDIISLIEANAEIFPPINGASGGVTTSVLDSDTLNGDPVDPADITLSIDASDPELTLDPSTGLITVASGTSAGPYTVEYTICEKVNPSNCASVTETVEVVRPAVVTAKKTVAPYIATGSGSYALPGNDVVYTLSVTHEDGADLDDGSVLLIDALPSEITFYHGDFDDVGPETNPVIFTQTNSSLTFNYAADVRYSDLATAPASFSDCVYLPNAGYDPHIKFVCINPKGPLTSGTPDPSFSVSFRAQIR